MASYQVEFRSSANRELSRLDRQVLRKVVAAPEQSPDRAVPIANGTATAFYRLDLKPGQHPSSGVIRWDGKRKHVEPLGWLDHGTVVRGEPAAGGNAE